MIKVVVLPRRPASWTRDRFHRWWRYEHVPYAKALPELRKYSVCHWPDARCNLCASN